MITYNPAFDLYHCIYRMAHIAQKLDDGESFEIDKVRIWDFYLLFPSKLFDVTIRLPETDIRDARNQYVKRIKNPYEYCGDNRKLFEWIKPFQLSALNCLVSYGILSKDDYLDDRVSVANRMTLDTFIVDTQLIGSQWEVIHILSQINHFININRFYMIINAVCEIFDCRICK